MCTTGAKILRPRSEFVLFKNRDFRRAHFDDRLSVTEEAFGVMGLETWDDPDQDRFSGFSIGFNRRLACCDSNVRTVKRGDNYDKLVQGVVENCATIEESVEQVQRMVGERLYCWANMIVATPDGVAALEVRGHHVEVESNPAFIARANHHVCLGATPKDDDTITTLFRYQTAFDGLKAAQGLDDLFAILRTHHPSESYGVCNHGRYNTVYSYVVHWNEGEITFYVLQGHPCEGQAYVKLPVSLGLANDLSGYPSRHEHR
jgi:hypothetical protein